MEKPSIHIECTFSEDGELQQILRRSFSLYLDRVLAETEQKPYNRPDEWSLISGGSLCT